MFTLIKQLLFVLLSFSGILASNCVSLNNEPWIILDLNPIKLNYYSFMISLENWDGSCNVDEIIYKKCLQGETTDINATVFNMIRITEAKTFVKHISCHCKRRFNSTTCNWNQKSNNDKC